MLNPYDYAHIFKTGQYGRFYVVSGSHARGLTFYIYILPQGVDAIPNGEDNPPLNRDAVEVYGIISGHPGWDEKYGWLHRGKWCEDFEKVIEERIQQVLVEKQEAEEARAKEEKRRGEITAKLLAEY